MRNGCTEDGHHGVANELLDPTPEGVDFPAQTTVIRLHARAHIFRVGLFGGRREADDIAKENRDDLALLRRRRCVHIDKSRTTVRAELETLRTFLAASRTCQHQTSV
jgi:hypothetical protein